MLAPIPLFPPTGGEEVLVGCFLVEVRGLITKDADETWTLGFEGGVGEVDFV